MVLARSSIRATSAHSSTFPAIAPRSIVADTHNLASAPTSPSASTSSSSTYISSDAETYRKRKRENSGGGGGGSEGDDGDRYKKSIKKVCKYGIDCKYSRTCKFYHPVDSKNIDKCAGYTYYYYKLNNNEVKFFESAKPTPVASDSSNYLVKMVEPRSLKSITFSTWFNDVDFFIAELSKLVDRSLFVAGFRYNKNMHDVQAILTGKLIEGEDKKKGTLREVSEELAVKINEESVTITSNATNSSHLIRCYSDDSLVQLPANSIVSPNKDSKSRVEACVIGSQDQLSVLSKNRIMLKCKEVKDLYGWVIIPVEVVLDYLQRYRKLKNKLDDREVAVAVAIASVTVASAVSPAPAV